MKYLPYCPRLFGTLNALTVAASNTPEILKRKADYRCTGDAERGGDQEIINMALSKADAVILLPGTFWVSDSIILASNKMLVGSGPSSIIKLRNNNEELMGLIVNSDPSIGNSNITVAHLQLDGNKENQEEEIFHNGLAFINVSSSIVAFCQFKNFTSLGMYIEASRNNIIIGNICEGNEDSGLHLTSSHNNRIIGNISRGSDEGMGIFSSNCNLFAENEWTENNYRGIGLYECYNNVLIGNMAKGHGHEGIHLFGGGNNIVLGNICIENETGIYVDGSNRNTVSNNTVERNKCIGILLEYASDNIISQNTVSENSQRSHNVYNNIHISHSNRNLISGNICRKGYLANKPKYGISIADSSCSLNVIEGNNLIESGETGDINDAGTNTRRRDNVGNDGNWLTDV